MSVDVIMPQLGETVLEGIVALWHKRAGEAVSADEPLFVVETDKVTTEIPSPTSGVVAEILVPAGQRVKVGTRLAVIQARSGAVVSQPAPPRLDPEKPPAAPERTPAPPSRQPSLLRSRPEGGESRLSPVVRKLLAEHNLDPAEIEGSGASGRITREDVHAHLARRRGAASPAGSVAASEGDETVVPMSKVRKITAALTARSVAVSPHVLQAVEVDFSAVEQARKVFGNEDASPTYLPFIARAVCRAIAKFPRVNASVRGEELVVRRRVHLGIAVDLAFEGVIVPVIRDAQDKEVLELSRVIRDLSEKARRGALTNDDLAGGTYTLSNSGAFGTLLTAPIILQPQVAILSTDGVRKRPVVVEREEGDTIAIRPVGILAQCFDHRAFDGAYSAAFLREVKEILERGG